MNILSDGREAKIKDWSKVSDRAIRKWDLEKRRQNKKASNKKYYLSHPDKYNSPARKIYLKEYKIINKGKGDINKKKERARRYNLKHREDIKKKRKDYMKEYLKKYSKYYKEKNRKKLNEYHNLWRKKKRRMIELLNIFTYENLRSMARIMFSRYQRITQNKYKLYQDYDDIIQEMIVYALEKLKKNCMSLQKGSEKNYIWASMEGHVKVLAHRKYKHNQHEFLINTNDSDTTMEEGLSYLNNKYNEL